MKLFTVLILAPWAWGLDDERAEVEIKYARPCGRRHLPPPSSRLGQIEVVAGFLAESVSPWIPDPDNFRHRSKVSFRGASVAIDPPNPTIPGCLRLLIRYSSREVFTHPL